MLTRGLLLRCCFLVFLVPISIGLLSVNYSFVVLPLLMVLGRGAIQRPPVPVLCAIVLFGAILPLAMLYQTDFLPYTNRRLMSFAVFMTMFAFVFTRVDRVMVESFESAVIIISVLFSLWSIVVFVAEGQEIGFEAKDLVGSQRFGFIYLVAIWAVYLNPARWMTLVKAKYAILLILIGGLLLTFSRASIAGLVVSAGLFVISRQWAWMRHPTLRGVGRAIGATVGAAIVVTVLYAYLPLTFTFFGERLFNVVRSAEAVESQLLDPETSVGTRVVILRRIVEFVLRNPLTGTGYLGVWVLPAAPAESAHNQYSDTLLRTGLIGFGAYLYLLWQVVRYLRNEHQHLFWGIVAVLTYGLFHETFKESQGAFLLAFLLGMTAQGWRDRRRLRLVRRSTAPSYAMSGTGTTTGTTVAAHAGGRC